MKQMNKAKFILLLAVLAQLVAMSEVSQELTRIGQLIALGLMGLALLVMRKKKRKAKRRAASAVSQEVEDFAELASAEQDK